MIRIFLVIFFTCLLNSSSVVAQKPNIILIVADDLGYGDLGCYGQQKIETPHIDKLAKEGKKFTQFYAGTAVCAPSRASLMTGLHTGHVSIRGNKGTKPEGQTPLPDSTTTFLHHLQKAGYATGAFGKWGLGYITTSGSPDKMGFDQFYGYNCQTLAHNYYPDHLWNNEERVELSENKKSNTVYSADLIHQQALQFIQGNSSKPFFLFLPYTMPHGEVIVPHDSLYSYYIQKLGEKPDTSKRLYEGRQLDPYPHASFAAMVTRLDRYVGEIVRLLERNRMADNTIILFTSDNGPHREGGGDPDFFDGNGPFRGIKRDLYEGGIRVPFIAYWKGKIKPGITKQLAAFWDLYPTFLKLAGIPPVKNTDGISIVPTLLGGAKQKQHDYFYWEFHENNGRQAVRWKNWKGVRLNVGKDEKISTELYDLKTDPGEQNNVASKYPAIVKRIEQILKEAHVHNKDWPLLVSEK
ncbi:MAG: arylsulfatase [Chitinophagaceae bacterium]|nr:arylsulfatase [Chitinophagaceae bacterium]